MPSNQTNTINVAQQMERVNHITACQARHWADGPGAAVVVPGAPTTTRTKQQLSLLQLDVATLKTTATVTTTTSVTIAN